MKSRIIVWSLVGIVVVIGVILIVTAPRNTRGPRLTLDIIKNEAVQAEVQLDRLVARLDARRKSAARGAGTEGLDEAERLLADAREKLSRVKEATGLSEAQKLLIEGREALRKARRAVELATRPASRPRGMY